MHIPIISLENPKGLLQTPRKIGIQHQQMGLPENLLPRKFEGES